jgi:hypothetical protein
MRPPVLAVGDGALGFWAALRDVWPETAEQRCWVHKVANVLDALPKSTQPTAKKMLAEIRDAEDRDHAQAAAGRFDAEFRSKWPKAADKVTGDLEVLLRFYDFPAEHWIHLKTTNPIESTFSTVRLRTSSMDVGGRSRRSHRSAIGCPLVGNVAPTIWSMPQSGHGDGANHWWCPVSRIEVAFGSPSQKHATTSPCFRS